MRFWDKSLQIFNGLCDHGTQRVRRRARKTGCSKSRVHRLKQAMESRGIHAASWWWETEEGRRWLTRLIVATLSTCGLKRGVGMDTMRELFTRLRLERQVGCSPSAFHGVMQALEAALLETAGRWEQDGRAAGERRESIGAVEETFLARMLLVFMDLRTGSLRLEAVAEDRTYATWKAWVDERLQALGTGVRSLVSDRAKAFIQRADQGLECLSRPDVFPVMHDLVQCYALPIARRVRQARQECKKAEEVLRQPPCLEGAPQAPHAAQPQGERRRADVQRWERVPRT